MYLATEKKSKKRTDHSAQLQTQLKMAGALQRDFLPKTLPNSEKLEFSVAFMPADCVSGDIYDIARLDEKHIGFYLADAVGHSMPAALLTIFIKQAIVMRETTGNSYKLFEPLEVINNLNQKMCAQQLSGCQFATGCYCILNTETMRLDYCRAGHPYPILIRTAQEPVQLQTKGALLGVFDNAQFEQGSVQLQKGDKLILYSDGGENIIGIEQSGEKLQFNKNFRTLLDSDAAEITRKFEKLAADSNSDEPQDDISMVVLQIK